MYVLILAGGGGTRLWPLSRDNYSKQFLTLFGDKSLLQLTYDRAKLVTSPSNIWVSTTQEQLKTIHKQLPKISGSNYSVEPMRKNTAWAQGLAAAYIFKRDPEAIIINLASDHLIKDLRTYKKCLLAAAMAAQRTNKIITVGINPTHLHEGYEYIHMGQKVSRENDTNVYKVASFIKRTDIPKIKEILRDKTGLWNANNFTWKASTLLNAYKILEPKIYSGLMKIYQAIGSEEENQVKRLVFQMAKSTQIDFIFTGRSNNLLVIKGEFDWTDIGDWSVVWQNLPKDSLGNVISGPHGRGEYIGIDSSNNLLFLDKQLIATVGLKDMLIVDTPDAILICSKNDAQAVKKVVETLKEQKLTKYL